MQTMEMRLRRIQYLAHEIMDEMHRKNEPRQYETMNSIIDNLARAIGDLTDSSGNYSLDYLEDKVGKAHYLLFKNEKKVQFIGRTKASQIPQP